MTPEQTEKLAREVIEAGERAHKGPWTWGGSDAHYMQCWLNRPRFAEYGDFVFDGPPDTACIAEGIEECNVKFITLTRVAAPKLAEECLSLTGRLNTAQKLLIAMRVGGCWCDLVLSLIQEG